jgi:hypothetical protein
MLTRYLDESTLLTDNYLQWYALRGKYTSLTIIQEDRQGRCTVTSRNVCASIVVVEKE